MSSPHSVRAKALWQDPAYLAKMEARRQKFVLQVEAIERAGEKECVRCHKTKPLAEFPEGRKRRTGKPRYAYCKTCHAEYQREQRLRGFFNITPEEYEKLLAFQGGVCAVCRKPPTKKRLAVDHDHRTGLIRGLLCTWCNRALGQFRDDMEKVRRTAAYYEAPPLTQMLGAPRFGRPGRTTNKAATTKRLERKLEKARAAAPPRGVCAP